MAYAIAFIGGLVTIASPCILPVLPFVFARAGHSFRRGALPLLLGMAVTFAAVGSLAAVAGQWVVRANQAGRGVALVVFGLLGLTLLLPSIADRVFQPFVRAGGRIGGVHHQPSVAGSLLLGVSTGFLWAPCAGPILGLILGAVALEGPTAGSVGLLLSFAAGAAVALALALLAGGRVFAFMKRALPVEGVVRRALGAAVLAGVVAIAMGWDTGILANLSLTTVGTATEFEQRLVDRIERREPAGAMSAPAMMMMAGSTRGDVRSEGPMPPLDGAVQWINSTPLTTAGLRGQVVLIDFWTYSCINCLRAMPYVKAWAEKYQARGLVVVGVHTPEFAFERDPSNVERATRRLALPYPVAIDSDRVIWNAFGNRFWPAHYLIDATGTIRHHKFGEGAYDETERMIQSLLAERNHEEGNGEDTVTVAATGVQAAPDLATIQSPETYVGYERQENYASPQSLSKDTVATYTAPTSPAVNQWGLEGQWSVAAEHGESPTAGSAIVFRFHARDLHLVLAPGADGAPVRFRVLLDGKPPAGSAGVDLDAQGHGVVTESRLYQLIRQTGDVGDRTFRIEFLDPGVQAFAFTFG